MHTYAPCSVILTPSASSSPRTSFLKPVEFSQASPSIDELEEIDGQQAMADTEPRSNSLGSSVSKSTPRPSNSHPLGDHSPNVGSKFFPILTVNLSTRPSSTPIFDHFASWPTPQLSKHSAFAGPVSLPLPSAELHVKNTVEPRELYNYMYKNKLKVLMLDICV